MSASATDAGRYAQPKRGLVFDKRLMGVAAITEVVAVALAYMALYVPVLGPKLTREEATRHWLAAVVGATVVILFSVVIVRATLRARALSEGVYRGRVETPTHIRLPRIPRSLMLERVPVKWARAAVALSLSTLPVTIGLGAPLWAIWLALLAPWAPVVAVESAYKLAYDPVYAAFGLMVILQCLHMVEHSTQITQLALTGGVAEESHGVIGQLDFETVHFVADTALWLSLGLMAVIFRGRNVWLWVAFVAAGMHEVEHLYLFWMYVFEHTLYLSGGASGILGHYGLVGTPLDRPYLHYTYNFIVFVPLLIAFWDQARFVDRVRERRAS